MSQVDATMSPRDTQLLEPGRTSADHVSEFDVGDDDVARHDGGQAWSSQSICVERFGKVHAAIINSISISAREVR